MKQELESAGSSIKHELKWNNEMVFKLKESDSKAVNIEENDSTFDCDENDTLSKLFSDEDCKSIMDNQSKVRHYSHGNLYSLRLP